MNQCAKGLHRLQCCSERICVQFTIEKFTKISIELGECVCLYLLGCVCVCVFGEGILVYKLSVLDYYKNIQKITKKNPYMYLKFDLLSLLAVCVRGQGNESYEYICILRYLQAFRLTLHLIPLDSRVLYLSLEKTQTIQCKLKRLAPHKLNARLLHNYYT